jgi:signal transduction histidine kinase
MGTLAAASLVLGGGEASSEFLAAMVAVYSAAANTGRHRLVAAVTVAAGAVHVVRDPHVHGVGGVAFGAGFLAVPFLFGVVVHGRGRRISTLEDETARLDARRAEDARAAVAAERARVARELHDVVAHAVSVVVVQSQAGQRLVGRDDDGARQSLQSIEETARTALDEMRRLFGLLRDADAATPEPQPGLGRLDELVGQVCAAGLAVALEVEGEPVRLPPASISRPTASCRRA